MYVIVTSTAHGITNQSFKKLITSAPRVGIIRLSLRNIKRPKFARKQNIISAMGRNTRSSFFSIGQRIFCRLLRWQLKPLVFTKKVLKTENYYFINLMLNVLFFIINTQTEYIIIC